MLARHTRIMLGVQTLGIVYALVFAFVADASAARSERHFEVTEFERLHIEGALEVVLEQADMVRGVRHPSRTIDASGTAASLATLAVESSDGTLYIVAGDGATATNLTVHLAVGALVEIVSAGAPRVYGSGLQQRELALEGLGGGVFKLDDITVKELFINGAGSTRFALSGSTIHQVIDMTGVSRYAAPRLSSETSHIEVRGASEVQVWADELLEVIIMGAARVSYAGEPWVRQEIVGAGSISRI